MQQTASTLPTFQHFQLERVAAGVYVAIASQTGGAYSNAGIIDLGGHTLIFDTFMTPQAAKDLRAAAEQLTGHPGSFVVNSHAHSDHWCGNQVFAPHATLIATHKTREMMPSMVDYLNECQADPSELEEMLREDQERLKTETDERWRTSLALSLARWQHVLEALPTLELRLPNQTFDGKLVFHGKKRTAELLTSGIGHTPSDCFLVLGAEKIAFLGDLAFFQQQPFMGSCDPQAWQDQLEGLEQSDFEILVPGHGPLGTKADVALQRQYITALGEWVAGWLKDGLTVEEAARQPLPAPFDAWPASPARFEANVHFLYQRLAGE